MRPPVAGAIPGGCTLLGVVLLLLCVCTGAAVFTGFCTTFNVSLFRERGRSVSPCPSTAADGNRSVFVQFCPKQHVNQNNRQNKTLGSRTASPWAAVQPRIRLHLTTLSQVGCSLAVYVCLLRTPSQGL